MTTTQSPSNESLAMWYWDERTNALESRVTNPTKKSNIVKTICKQYLLTDSHKQNISASNRREVLEKLEAARAQKRNASANSGHGNGFTRGAGGNLNQNNPRISNMETMKAQLEQKAHLQNLFKRTVLAAGKVAELGRMVCSETHRDWSLDSVKKLAWSEMNTNVQQGNILSFNEKLKTLAVAHVQMQHGRNFDFYNCEDQNYQIKNRNYMLLLKKYIELEEFDLFGLALCNYFSVLFDLKKLLDPEKKVNENVGENGENDGKTKTTVTNSSKSPKEQKLQNLKIKELQTKRTIFEHKLGMAYACLLLGINGTKKYHHMSSGERRLCSFSKTDLVFGEILLEFCAIMVSLVFRADTTIDLDDIRIILGRQIRTDHFNPYFHEKIQQKLDTMKEISLPKINSTDSITSANKSKLVPIAERAAAERRIKGNRPSIAAIIHQKSTFVTAALKKSKEIDLMSDQYEFTSNMYYLNSARRQTTNKNRHKMFGLKNRKTKMGGVNHGHGNDGHGRQSVIAKNYDLNNSSPCKRLTVLQNLGSS